MTTMLQPVQGALYQSVVKHSPDDPAVANILAQLEEMAENARSARNEEHKSLALRAIEW